MSSRRKKKRNRLLQEQNGLASSQDTNTDAYPQAVSSDRYEADHDASAEEQLYRSETASATTDSGPPSIPRHDLPGPHIKFPVNAKRKSPEAESDKETKEVSEKKPGLLRFLKKDRSSDEKDSAGEVSTSSKSSKPARPEKPAKPKTSRKALKGQNKKFTDQIEQEANDPFARPKKRRWRSRLVWMFLMLILLIGALPWIVTKTPLLNIVLSMATGKLDGTVEVQSVSCGWFSGITVTELDIKDSDGNTVITVPSIEGNRSLLSLLWNRSNLGHFQIEKPIVHVVFDKDGSTNVQKMIAGYLEGPEGEPLAMTVDVTDAKVTLDAASSATTEKQATSQAVVTLVGVDVSLEMSADPDAKNSTVLSVSGSVEGMDKKPEKPQEPKTSQDPEGSRVSDLNGGYQPYQPYKSYQPAEAPEISSQATAQNPTAQNLEENQKPDGSSKPGTFKAKLALGQENRLVFNAEQIVLDRFSPLLNRVASGLTLRGNMTGRIDCRWNEIAEETGGENLLVEASLELNDFSANGGPLGTDALSLKEPTLACRLSGKDGVYVLQRANLKSEVATLELKNGQVVIDPNLLTGTSIKSLVKNQTFQLTGWVDLAQLAKMLPTTLHLKDQVEVRSGELTLEASAGKDERLKPLASGRLPTAWKAKVKISNVQGTRHHQQFGLYPITLKLDAQEADGDTVVINELLCESGFLHMAAEGNRDGFYAGIDFNLRQLTDQLGAFVDLGGLQMQGRVGANLSWQRVANQSNQNALPGREGKPAPQDRFILKSTWRVFDLDIRAVQSQISDLVRVGNPSQDVSDTLFKQPLRESAVVMNLKAEGQMPSGGPTTLDKVEVSITTGPERDPDTLLTASLTSTVKEISAKTVWPIHITARGQLARWIDRAHALGIATDWQAQGFCDATIKGSYRPEAMKFDSVTVDLYNVAATGPSVFINEPRIHLTLNGYYNRLKSQLIVSQATCQAAKTALMVKELVAGFPENGPMELAGTLGVDGELAQIHRWITDPNQPPSWSCQGHLVGQVDLTPKPSLKGDVLAGNVKATIQQLALGGSYNFYEPELTVTANGSYDLASNTIAISDAQLTSSMLNGQMQGRLLAGNDPMETDLDGVIAWNNQRLSQLAAFVIGPGVKLQKVNKSTINLKGPMTLDGMVAKTGIGWESGDIYGLQLGPGQIDLTLEKGLLNMAPLRMKANRGQINLATQLRVAPGPMTLDIQPGTIIDKVQVNRQMCENGLKYIAPILANVAQAEGKISLTINQCRIPIDNPKMSQATGQLKIHSMSVDSPFVKEFAPILQRATTANLKQGATVNFRMGNGWIYHEGLELVFPEFTVKTSGYVGVNQTLKLLAEISIPAKNGGGTNRTATQNRIIKLPIIGTLSKPRLDQRALQRELQRSLQRAGMNLLEKEGQKFFNQLMQ